MTKSISTTGRCALPMLLLITLAGCSQHDRDALSRIAGIVTSKAQTLAASPPEGLPTPPRFLRPNLDGLSLEERVVARLHWDKELADLVIHVHATDAVIELSGTVADAPLRQRAVQLALATVGVERVEDKLEAPAATPAP